MNSLEFIEQEIHFISVVKKENEKMLKDNRPEHTKEYIKTLIKEYEEKLNNLQQIKTELEAWEVVKDEIKVKEVLNYFYPQYRICLRCMNGLINKEQYETIKKALEVNNNG